MEDNIPTAEKVLKKEGFDLSLSVTYAGIDRIKDAMKRYAQLHVEAALKAASEKAMIDRKPTGEGKSSEEHTSTYFEGDLGYEDYIPVEYTINKESILSAYSKENIQ